MNLAYLCHRIPYPPDKGDKIRSYHQVEWLAERHQVHLFTLIDDRADERHIEPLRERVHALHVESFHPKLRRLKSLLAIGTGGSLSEAYFRDRRLMRQLGRVAAEQSAKGEPIDLVFAFSSAMCPYADSVDAPLAADYVDVDSAKWAAYAESARWPLSWLFSREAREVQALERRYAEQADLTVLCTPREEADLRSFCDPRAAVSIGNGTDTEYFCPDESDEASRPRGSEVVFSGAMDYRANVDAVVWYAEAVHPLVRAACPEVSLTVVGSNPAPAVQRLAEQEGVTVTGRVPDVRPYIRRATVAVAPLRVARGVQNKVLEALACGTPVVATGAALGGVPDPQGVEVAEDPQAFADSVARILKDRPKRDAMSAAGRAYIVDRFRWSRSMTDLEERLLAIASRPGTSRSDEREGFERRGLGHA